MMHSITTTKDLLIVLSGFVEEMNSNNSNLHKAKVFKKYFTKYSDRTSPFLRVIALINSNLIPFNVTASSVTKFKTDKKKQAKHIKPDVYVDGDEGKLALFKLLTDLHLRKISGDKGKQSIVEFINTHTTHEKLILNIIDKDLKIRFTAKSINDVVPDLIPLFEVSLGEKYDKTTKKYLSKPYPNGWYISRKLDGVRCLCKISFDSAPQINPKSTIDGFFKKKKSNNIHDNIVISFYSREGRLFKTLSKLKEDIKLNLVPVLSKIREKGSKGFILDGEVCALDDKGLENFQGIMREINMKNHIMKNPKYLLFDMLTIEEFDKAKSKSLFSSRLNKLNTNINASKCSRLSCIQQITYTEEAFGKMQAQVKENKWEGLILRKNANYQGKRSKDIIKVKKFHREEYTVKSIETAKMRMINENTRLEEEIETLKAVTILHKGNSVSVGSGFSLAQRKQYYNDPNSIIGKVISVQFFEETKDLNGGISLRFPTFKGLYGDKREF